MLNQILNVEYWIKFICAVKFTWFVIQGHIPNFKRLSRVLGCGVVFVISHIIKLNPTYDDLLLCWGCENIYLDIK